MKQVAQRKFSPGTGLNHKRKREVMLLRGGGCSLCGSFQGVDHDGLFAALRGGGMDGIQVDAFRCEPFEAFRQSTRLVGQIVLLRGSFRVGDPGRVEGFLGAPGIVDEELNRSCRALGSSQERERKFALAFPSVSRFLRLSQVDGQP